MKVHGQVLVKPSLSKHKKPTTMIIETRSCPRAALIGNPSDGYFGKTIAFVFDNFLDKVQLYHSPELENKQSAYPLKHGTHF